MEMVCYAAHCSAHAIADTPDRQIIETYWNTAVQEHKICSIALEAHTKEILKQACRSNDPHWILHTQTSTRINHQSIRLNLILFNKHRAT